ncbi:MAG: N-methyl-L-tryptophan oxidase [Thermoanaerobaculia bacterium]
MQHADVIVIGCGGVGSAALYHLARRGVSTVALDRFPVAHDRGSSHGETRIIRQAYFEHPDYVPLCRMSYDLWDELSAGYGKTLRHETGLLEVGPEDGVVVSGVLGSASRHGLEVERLSSRDVARRFPGYVVPDGMCGVLEARAGYLDVEECVRAHVDLATKNGARVEIGVSVLSWTARGRTIEVETDRGAWSADRLVITAGAWASSLLSDLGVPFEVRRKPLFWFHSPSDAYRADRGAPAFLYELPDGVFYGFPDLGDGRVKVAEHTGGDAVADPLEVDRTQRPADELRLTDFLAEHLPGVTDRVAAHAVCMYTMTPDEHFVVDRHPAHPEVVFAAGLSGHGFKMASVLGKALAELALDGATPIPIGFLGAQRQALRTR